MQDAAAYGTGQVGGAVVRAPMIKSLREIQLIHEATGPNLTNVDVGFNRSRLITFSTTLPQARYPQPASRAGFYQSMLERLRGVPGVTSASAMSGLPPERVLATLATDFDGYVAGPGDPPEFADYEQYVLGHYFQTMGIPILQGRGFEPSDATLLGLVVIVNKTLAETFWKGRDPIGRRLRPCCFNQPWATVVGVAADVKQGGIDKKAGTEFANGVIPSEGKRSCEGSSPRRRADHPTAVEAQSRSSPC